jgi:hypothetical protein
MAAKRYTLVMMTQSDDEYWVIHKPGCKETIQSLAAGATKELVKVDLEDSDEELLEALGAPLEWTMEDVDLCACTGYVDEPEPDPQVESIDEDDLDDEEDDDPLTAPPPASAAARASQAAARERLLKQVEETIDKLVAERGEDNVGEGDRWAEERLFACTDDYVYDLAVEVRKLRERGDSWWRVAYELHLPGSGASNKQGRKGSAFARRLWRAAWGKTYLGERGQRESKITREARAMENLGRPYFSAEATGDEVVKKVTGQMIHWVARLEGQHGLITSAQEAYVHDDPRLVKYKQGPMGPYIEFFEQLDPAMLTIDPRRAITKSGPLRAVYVDRITRVGV